MNDYKFKVGDTVRVLKFDDLSLRGMEANIGNIGVVINCNNDDEINEYLINISGCEYWYMEDSLELVEAYELTFNRTNVLEIIYTELYKDVSTETYNVLLNILNDIEKLKCK